MPTYLYGCLLALESYSIWLILSGLQNSSPKKWNWIEVTESQRWDEMNELKMKWLHLVTHFLWDAPLPMKFLLAEESRACFQPAGQAIRTALCFIPPSPADWMSREKPSRRLDETTTWEKPLVRSAAMAAFKFCQKHMEREGRDWKREKAEKWGFGWWTFNYIMLNTPHTQHIIVLSSCWPVFS